MQSSSRQLPNLTKKSTHKHTRLIILVQNPQESPFIHNPRNQWWQTVYRQFFLPLDAIGINQPSSSTYYAAIRIHRIQRSRACGLQTPFEINTENTFNDFHGDSHTNFFYPLSFPLLLILSLFVFWELQRKCKKQKKIYCFLLSLSLSTYLIFCF